MVDHAHRHYGIADAAEWNERFLADNGTAQGAAGRRQRPMSADILRRYLASQGMAAQLTHRRAHYPSRIQAAPTAARGTHRAGRPPVPVRATGSVSDRLGMAAYQPRAISKGG
ncbi:MAG TPA: hypothetical protein VHS58_04065, partial [Acetobacteraceae bacterium]|nr:hypothetical protein [Acetobacteraceae bacterium]